MNLIGKSLIIVAIKKTEKNPKSRKTPEPPTTRDTPLPQSFLPSHVWHCVYKKIQSRPPTPPFNPFPLSNFTTTLHNGGPSGLRRSDRYRSWYVHRQWMLNLRFTDFFSFFCVGTTYSCVANYEGTNVEISAFSSATRYLPCNTNQIISCQRSG